MVVTKLAVPESFMVKMGDFSQWDEGSTQVINFSLVILPLAEAEDTMTRTSWSVETDTERGRNQFCDCNRNTMILDDATAIKM